MPLSALMTKINILLTLSETLGLASWEIMRSGCGGMGEKLTLRVAFRVGFSLFLAFDFVTVTMEKPHK